MDYKDMKAIKWEAGPATVTFEQFYSHALKHGFEYIFTHPWGDRPTHAFAARTLDELNKIIVSIEPFDDISGFDFGN